MITSFEQLDRLCELLLRLNAPKQQNLYMDYKDYIKTNKFLFSLCSPSVISDNMETGLTAIKINYMGYQFNIISY